MTEPGRELEVWLRGVVDSATVERMKQCAHALQHVHNRVVVCRYVIRSLCKMSNMQ